MKRLVSALAGFLALGWSGMALAQATPTPTPIPICASLANFTCAFTAAETMSLVTPSKVGSPGQPDVYVGYLAFDATGGVTLTGTSNINGTVTTGISMSGTCAEPTAFLQPATINFANNNTQISFVTDASGTELQFILSQDQNTNTSSKIKISNSVRVGVCRKQ